MAEEYEKTYDDNSTYDEEDMGGGGEQFATAIYLNEQLQQQAQAIQTKQNLVILQPTEPPLNPATGDMWIDTSIFPHTTYAWDGTQWKRTGVISAEEVGSYTVAQVDTHLGTMQVSIGNVASRTEAVETTIGDGEGFAAKITQTTTYQTDRDGAVSTGISGFKDNLKDEEWTNENLPKMVTSSILQREVDAIKAEFETGGGVNLLKNSSALADLLHWQVMSGSATKYMGDECIEAKAGFSIGTGVMKQAVTATAGQPYTLTLKVSKGTAGTAYVKLSDGTTFQQIDFIATAAYDMVEVQIKGFIPGNNQLIVELGATGTTSIFTAIMLNLGNLGAQWSHANGEMYNTAVTFDINGVNVKSSVYDGYTVMSPEEFSGYYRNAQGVMQRVFTLNGKVTEVAKLKITDTKADIEMGSIKMTYVNGGGYRGWAFIPS